ncbi:methyltransferase domain-containing protein [Cupriavidus basilensis]|uniref:methyltransferase domain-containing protein n=1 Tax=Cupriavidus basilensis TaxID=68895 RepID=UPI000B202970|nr:methyltransferase domain-containing protein [Cupriavidus basilensis]
MSLEQRIATFREGLCPLDKIVRSDRLELLDTCPERAVTDRIVNDIERVSQYIGLRRLLVQRIAKQVEAVLAPPGEVTRIAEICCGNGWVLRALDGYLARRGIDVELTGLDMNPDSLRTAEGLSRGRAIRWRRENALALPMADQSVDVLVNVQSLHHFRPDELVRIMRESSRVAKRSYFFDLRRTTHGFLIVHLLRPLTSWAFIHDAALSHRRAYRVEELQFIAQEALVNADIAKLTPIGLEIVIGGKQA